jgi:uncharacterized protein YneF (UPF0154 family)
VVTLGLVAIFLIAIAAFLTGFIQGAFTQRRYDRRRRRELLRSIGGRS